MARPIMRAPRKECPRHVNTKHRTSQFHNEFQPGLKLLARECPASTRAMIRAPLLAIVLADAPANCPRRKAALELLSRPSGINRACALIGIPKWQTKLPAGAFTSPLAPLLIPQAIGEAIADFAPDDPDASACWLRTMALAWPTTDLDALRWLANQVIYSNANMDEIPVLPLALFIAFSNLPDSEAGKRIRQPWKPDTRLTDALIAALNWLNRLKLHLLLGKGQFLPPWMAEGSARGHDFHALDSEEKLRAHALQQNNCVEQYADRLTDHTARLYSVSKEGRLVATLELTRHPNNIHAPQLKQIKGRFNQVARPEVFLAAYAWMGAQTGGPIPAATDMPNCRIISSDDWKVIWGPVLANQRLHDFLCGAPPIEVLETLEKQIRVIARLARVDSYLFGLRHS